MPDSEPLIDRLRIDLLDGEDLSLTLSLITDVLERRVKRVRHALEEIERSEVGDERLLQITGQVQRRMVKFEEQVGARRDQLQEVITEFQVALDEFARALEQD